MTGASQERVRVMDATGHIKVNGFEVNWTEDTRRKARNCVECGNPTFGRSDVSDASRKSGMRSEAACVGCAFKRAMRMGLNL
jgi:hypothetical protein